MACFHHSVSSDLSTVSTFPIQSTFQNTFQSTFPHSIFFPTSTSPLTFPLFLPLFIITSFPPSLHLFSLFASRDIRLMPPGWLPPAESAGVESTTQEVFYVCSTSPSYFKRQCTLTRGLIKPSHSRNKTGLTTALWLASLCATRDNIKAGLARSINCQKVPCHLFLQQFFLFLPFLCK